MATDFFDKDLATAKAAKAEDVSTSPVTDDPLHADDIASHRMVKQKEELVSQVADAAHEIEYLQKKQQELMSQQSRSTMDRMKISLFFMIPFLIIWRLLGSFFGGITIAFFPIKIPLIPENFSVANWYILCSITINIIISRVLGLTFEIEPEDI